MHWLDFFNDDTFNAITTLISAGATAAAVTPKKVQKANSILASLFGIINLIGFNFGGAKNK